MGFATYDPSEHARLERRITAESSKYEELREQLKKSAATGEWVVDDEADATDEAERKRWSSVIRSQAMRLDLGTNLARVGDHMAFKAHELVSNNEVKAPAKATPATMPVKKTTAAAKPAQKAAPRGGRARK